MGPVLKLPLHLIDEAIAIAAENRGNHEQWADWRRRGHDDNPLAGDLEHHERAIEEYDLILGVLRGARANLYPEVGEQPSNRYGRDREGTVPVGQR